MRILRNALFTTLQICFQPPPISSPSAVIGAADHRVWEVARLDGYVLVTKDEDFHRLSVLRGAPPKVIWIRIGNYATADVARLLRFRAEHIHEFAADVESAILALG